jgi:hypothetical protein
MKNVLPASLFFAMIAVAQAAIIVQTTSPGDGYFHDETGSSWDYFDATSHQVSAYYTYWGTSDTMQYNTGYLQFALANIPDSAVLASATLNIYLTSSHYSAESPSAGFIQYVTNSSGANGLASQRLGGDVTLVEIKDQPLGWLTVDITSQLQATLDSGYAYAAFSANPNTAGYFRDAGYAFYSADYGANQPYIEVTLVPEPALAALVAGIPVLAWLLWRRRMRLSRVNA